MGPIPQPATPHSMRFLKPCQSIQRLCALTVMLLAAHAHADWRVLTFNADKTVTIWLETSTMQRRSDYVYAWVIYDRLEPAQDGSMSSKALNQYDCENRQARTWRQSFYTKSMTGGDSLPPKRQAQCEAGDSLDIALDDSCTQPWQPVLYRTTGADILNELCIGKAAMGQIAR